MKQGHARHPAMMVATVLSVLILSVFALAAGAVVAQTNPPPGVQRKAQPESEAAPRFEAPVGHRQPRPSELPPSIWRDERRGPTAGERALDRKLKICKDC
ncbi:MAG: hypothetical protein GEU95_11920 [Rhizobiales bacterium]|nr:hypothetical protein [Hyphomicrobiales bacterium]